MSLSLSGEGIEYLHPGQIQTTFSYRYLYADEGYIGTEKVADWYQDTIGARLTLHSFDLNLTYGLTNRFSLSLITPFIHAEGSTKFDNNGGRNENHSTGFGDLRLTANGWIWDPAHAHNGNISLSLGVKAPTGDDKVRGTYYRAGPPPGQTQPNWHKEHHPADIALQLGDGGWGVMTEVQAFRAFRENLYGYLTGFYLINPREKNHSGSQVPIYGTPGCQAWNCPGYRSTSVPDQYQARAGLSYVVWPSQALAVSLGARIDGIPTHDLIGGSDGWRRPGYSVYVEPGGSVTRWKTTFSLFVPVGVAYNRQKNVLDMQNPNLGAPPAQGHGPGAFANYVIQFGVTRAFTPFWSSGSGE